MRRSVGSLVPLLVILPAPAAAAAPAVLSASRHDTSAPFGQLSAAPRTRRPPPTARARAVTTSRASTSPARRLQAIPGVAGATAPTELGSRSSAHRSDGRGRT